jgi:hypothetical protein
MESVAQVYCKERSVFITSGTVWGQGGNAERTGAPRNVRLQGLTPILLLFAARRSRGGFRDEATRGVGVEIEYPAGGEMGRATVVGAGRGTDSGVRAEGNAAEGKN